MNRHCKCLVMAITLATMTFSMPVKTVDADTGNIKSNKQYIQNRFPIAKTTPMTIKIKPLVYNPDNLNEVSNINSVDIDKMLGDTSMKGLEDAFLNAEKTYGVNALFLIGVVALESGWNTSNRSTNGSNNITSYAVYNKASQGTLFDSKAECIYATARLLKNEYLNSKGQWYKGTSIWDVNKNYCVTNNWASDINSIIHDLIHKANKSN